jgi:hypothetical protein
VQGKWGGGGGDASLRGVMAGQKRFDVGGWGRTAMKTGEMGAEWMVL